MNSATRSRRTPGGRGPVSTPFTRRLLLPLCLFPPTTPARKQELLVPLLAFWKCHAIYPEAFQPVKLKQRCKAETLMKCINLEHRASLLITAWFVYEPSQKQKTERKEEEVEEEAEAALLRGRLCNGPYTHTYILSISASPPGCK